MYLVTSDQMQALDSKTMEQQGVPGIVLMDHAGKMVAEAVLRLRPNKVVVCAGKGNNGGDGWTAARWCRHFGVETEVVSMVDPSELRGHAKVAAKAAIASGVSWHLSAPEASTHAGSGPAGSGQSTPEGAGVPPGLPEADVYVDALLGTGVSRPLAGPLKTVVEQLNASGKPVVAVDVPTGVDPSTGEVPGVAVNAVMTVCLAAQKLGTAVTPGASFAGEVVVGDIGIDVPNLDEFARFITAESVAEILPQRGSMTHKGSFGRLVIAVGDMQGAPMLAGMAALRAGAGLVALVSDDPLVNAPPEFVLRRRTSSGAGLPEGMSALVLGPGLGEAVERWCDVVQSFQGPCVVDADGLRLMSVQEAGAAGLTSTTLRGRPIVLTPHPKECARMLGWSTRDVQAHRLDAAHALAKRTGCIVVLKGFHSLVVGPDGQTRVNPTGDASLATAGTGDVLAGMIGSLLAQQVTPFEAACAGVWLHGKAGELAGEDKTPVSVIASDVVDSISRAIRSVSTYFR